jgi:hypothetical protein
MDEWSPKTGGLAKRNHPGSTAEPHGKWFPRWRSPYMDQGVKRIVILILCAALNRAICEDFPPVSLSDADKALIYQQAKLTPGARQIGLSCAFYANVPLLTMASGVNIADGSVASKDFVSSIYGLRRGDFKFMSAFDRDMFFKLFHIPSKRVDVYYRDASRGELLSDAEETVTRNLAAALDQGQFVSLRVLGDFGGPHNVLLLAHRSGTYYHLDPRTGRVVKSPSAELASKILTVSKARSKTKRRYYSSYHLVALPAPVRASGDFQTPLDFPKELEIALTPEQKSSISASLARAEDGVGVSGSFPNIGFATTKDGSKSVIKKDLGVFDLRGVYNLSKLALNSHKSGKRDVLPVWLLDGKPRVMIGYAEGAETKLILSDGNSRAVMALADALGRFRQSGCFLGYVSLSGK